MVKNSSGQWYLASEKLELDEPPLYSTVQVIGQEGQEGRPSYTIFCDEVEFSSLEHGKALFHAVARHVLNQRNSGQRYPIYITDVDLAPGLLGMERREELQTVVYLNYKRHIEDRLNNALLSLLEKEGKRAAS